MLRFKLRSRPGSALFMVIVAVAMLGLITTWLLLFNSLTYRTIRARNQLSASNLAAESVVRVMAERLAALAQQSLGNATPEQLDSLTAESFTIPLPAGFALDTSLTGYTLVGTDSLVALPEDLQPAQVTPDWPRSSWTATPPAGGALAHTLSRIRITAAVDGPRGGTRAAKATVALARAMPHQSAVVTDDVLEVCVTGGPVNVSGPLRAAGDIRTRCAGDVYFSGPLRPNGDLLVSGTGRLKLAWQGAEVDLHSVSTGSIGSIEALLAEWGGRVVLGGATGGELTASPFQDPLTAGSGECADFMTACGGASVYFPSLLVQRTTAGAGGEFQAWCGYAYNGASCTADAEPAIRYVPLPFSDPVPPGVALPDPVDPTRLWQGLLVDYRREARCTATVGSVQFRTFRCPTNPFGFDINVGALPPIPGGLLTVLRAAPNGAPAEQEIVLLENASHLAGPLTIHSQLPVYIVGSFNTVEPKPAMIDAPFITVLPANAMQHFATAAAWDSSATSIPLAAAADVELRAVLRSDYHPTDGSGYWGGTIEQIPSVLGDWSGVGLRVVGALQGRSVPAGTPGTYSSLFPPYGGAPSEVATLQPATRDIRFDPPLLDPAFQPPGSWSAANLSASGAGPTRSRARQLNAAGGYTLFYWLELPARLAASRL